VPRSWVSRVSPLPVWAPGYGAFSYSRVAEMMINTVSEHLGGESDSEEVLFVLYSDEA